VTFAEYAPKNLCDNENHTRMKSLSVLFQIFLFKDKIEQIIKVTEKVVPKMITGINNVALSSKKNFWGPADNKHISPTMMEDI